MAAIPQKQNLCDYCHQKPKRANHDYCGKTCSQQAAVTNHTSAVAHHQPQIGPALCKQCNQKPRFQGFDFCGKNCATNWQLTHSGSSGNSNPPVKKSGGNAAGQMGPNTQIPGQPLGNTTQPLSYAQLQAVIPAVVAALQQGSNQPQQQKQPPTNASLNVSNVPVPPSNTSRQFTVVTTLAPNNPHPKLPQQKTNVNQNTNGMGGPGVPQNAHGPTSGINNHAVPNSGLSQLQTATPTTCRLTGCGKPVYMDATSNQVSEYCSKRHREEAVIIGQVKACVMCLKMPRSSTDHFCSKACREAALSQ
ncbi:hypothetical protein BDM02DRAFT_3114857 [Thelephora ganbajun]|uniref:Uncharacterized protein n=1 Tax=Thelephora ganbajun TaxID=370292 RepID=A0ACB6ZI64_THEGA|nr:hypothetical protein BDM02DRAFT_3114857 [Thelephora ganbajun]